MLTVRFHNLNLSIQQISDTQNRPRTAEALENVQYRWVGWMRGRGIKIRQVEDAKLEFAPPALIGDRDNRTLTFFLLEPQSFVVYSIQAIRNSDGTFSVTKTPVR